MQIARGARVNAVERGTHATPLITAAFQNDREMIDVLLAAGANPNLGDDMHMVPLHYAAAWGYDEIVDKLMCVLRCPYPRLLALSLLAFNDDSDSPKSP